MPRRASAFELALVLGLPTIAWACASLSWLTHRGGHATLSDTGLLAVVGEEAVFCGFLLPFLRGRGWSPAAVAGEPEPKDVLRGALVWLSSYVAFVVVWIAFVSLAPALGPTLRTPPFTVGASAASILFVSVLNSVFEEFLWLGYGVSALRSRVGLRGACLVSIALRVAIHAYQGPMAIVGIVPLAVVFTLYYARTGRLWPVVVAHIIADAAGFASLHR